MKSKKCRRCKKRLSVKSFYESAREVDKEVFKDIREASKRRRAWTMQAYSIPVGVPEAPPVPVGEWIADAFLGKSNAEVVMPIGMRVFGEMILQADGRVMFKVEDDHDNVSTVVLHWKQKA